MEMFLGIVLVTVAGLGTGSIAWPMKIMHKLQFEHYWFVGMFAGLIVVPWLVVLIWVPQPLAVYVEVGWRPLIVANLFAIAWGLANVLYGVCVVRIGAALSGAILTGLGITVGITLPMIFKGTGLFKDAPDLISKTGLVIMSGAAIVLVGVLVISLAGFGREQALKSTDTPAEQASGSFLGGLIMMIVAGLTSCGIIMTFIYSQGPIVKAVVARGAGEIPANIAVWAVGLLGGALVNLIYPAYLMTKNKSWNVLT
ncbi:MAG: L-rhamnose/proton symporter RhaT, partial [Planctomycetota bacterium]